MVIHFLDEMMFFQMHMVINISLNINWDLDLN
jgi:hypothetical protein